MRRNELPDILGASFRVAEAHEAGVSRCRLRARDLDAPHRGMRVRRAPEAQVPAAADPPHTGYERRRLALIDRARVYSRVMPDNQFFAHVVSAAAWKLSIPISLLDATAPLDVGVLAPQRHVRRAGIRGHQLQPDMARVVELDGLRVLDPASTWACLASVLASDIELIAAGDACVREQMFRDDRPPIATLEDLAERVGAGRWRGVRRLRAALASVRTRSASSGETRCRIRITDAGLPEPELNASIYDDAGGLIAVVDLCYRHLKVAIEYEGEQHRVDPVQWAKDIARHEQLVARGWIVIRVTKAQLYGDPRAVVGRVRRALAARAC